MTSQPIEPGGGQLAAGPPVSESIEFVAAEIPPREQTGADHDEPWQYQPYHLSDRQKLALWRRRDQAVAEEWSA